jgi:aryl-alcohol dehydrogenase-like predicted oxidoreductase
MTLPLRTVSSLHTAVSEIGLGCWQLGAEWGPVSDQRAQEVLQAAHRAGVTFFDTADVYGKGLSERRIANFLRSSGARPFVATKVGRFPDPGFPGNFEFEVMRRHVLASRERLGVPILDLVQLHCVPPEHLHRGAVFAHLRRLRDEGVLRAWGASVESVAEAERCLQEPDCASLQLIVNVLRQTPVVSGLLDRCARQGVAVIVRLPLASGLLAGRMRADTKFAPDDHRTFNRDGAGFHVGETFAGLPFAEALQIVDELRPLLPAGVPMAQACMRWLLDHPAVTVVIPGATKPEQVLDNVASAALPPLGAAVHASLRAFWQRRVQPHVRGND